MIYYVKGNVLEPNCFPAVIVHVCNDADGFGKGVAGAIAAKWPEVKERYHRMKDESMQTLGATSAVRVSTDILVVNMVAQRGYRPTYEDDKKLYLHYPSLALCLERVYRFAAHANSRIRKGLPVVAIHMPRIGCGLGGGDWKAVEQFVLCYSDMYNVDTYVYDLE